jgi:hypothetical protein
MHADEIDDVATRFAPETDEPLLFDVNEKTRSPVFVEWAQRLPAVCSRSLKAKSQPLRDLQERVAGLDSGNVPV